MLLKNVQACRMTETKPHDPKRLLGEPLRRSVPVTFTGLAVLGSSLLALMREPRGRIFDWVCVLK